MKHCVKCGKKLANNKARYCRYCGFDIQSHEGEAATDKEAHEKPQNKIDTSESAKSEVGADKTSDGATDNKKPAPIQESTSSNAKRKKPPLLWVAAIAAVVVVVSVAIIMFFASGGDEFDSAEYIGFMRNGGEYVILTREQFERDRYELGGDPKILINLDSFAAVFLTYGFETVYVLDARTDEDITQYYLEGLGLLFDPEKTGAGRHTTIPVDAEVFDIETESIRTVQELIDEFGRSAGNAIEQPTIEEVAPEPEPVEEQESPPALEPTGNDFTYYSFTGGQSSAIRLGVVEYHDAIDVNASISFTSETEFEIYAIVVSADEIPAPIGFNDTEIYMGSGFIVAGGEYVQFIYDLDSDVVGADEFRQLIQGGVEYRFEMNHVEGQMYELTLTGDGQMLHFIFVTHQDPEFIRTRDGL